MRPASSLADAGRSVCLRVGALFVVAHLHADEADDDGEEEESGADEENSGIEVHEWLLVAVRAAAKRTASDMAARVAAGPSVGGRPVAK